MRETISGEGEILPSERMPRRDETLSTDREEETSGNIG